MSTDSSHRTQRLENRATAIPDELPSHSTLYIMYNESTAGHSTVRTKHAHRVTREASKVNMEEIDKINEADASAKAKQKAYADHHRGATSPIFKVGDQVLV